MSLRVLCAYLRARLTSYVLKNHYSDVTNWSRFPWVKKKNHYDVQPFKHIPIEQKSLVLNCVREATDIKKIARQPNHSSLLETEQQQASTSYR